MGFARFPVDEKPIEGKPAFVFEYVSFGTDTNVPEDVQCGKLIHAIGKFG